MKKITLLLITLLTSFAFTSCTTTRPAERPAYTGTDQVQEITKNMIIGEWTAEILNPIPGEEIIKSIRSTYNEDGTLLMIIHTENEGGVMPMTFELRGTWTIKNKKIVQKLDKVEETSGNVFAAIAASFANGMRDKQAGIIDVFQAKSSTLILVGEAGQAQELTRVSAP